MEQKRLFRTIDRVASKDFSSEHELLIEVVKQLVVKDQINITGGRVWKLDVQSKAYTLVFQAGNVHRIERGFRLLVKDYPVFELIVKERTILANETNKILRKKGILRYSVSGVGSKLKVDNNFYYEYLLAVNSENIDDALGYTLNIVATVLTSKLRERRISTSHKNLFQDIDKAKQLQNSILPDHEFTFHNYELYGLTIPAEIVGGDFYDYLTIGSNEERLGIVLGDAASKGLAAAAEAMYISGAIRMTSNFQIKISPLMYQMNQLVNKIFSDDKFASLFYGEISDDKKGLFLYANAGHNPPIFVKSKNRQITFLAPTGPLLGPAPNSKYETDSINFNEGDVLVIFSDGIVEAANEKYEFYEEKRLKKVILKNLEKSPKEIVNAIMSDVINFSTNDSKYQDDKTIVVIKRKERHGSYSKNI